MVRDLAIVLSLVLSGAFVVTACSGECDDCCNGPGCESGCASEGTGSNCGSTVIEPNDGGPFTCFAVGDEPRICSPGVVQQCTSISKSPAKPSCASGEQHCNGAGTGFSVCDDVLPHPDVCDGPSDWSCDGEPPACGSATWATSIAGPENQSARSVAVDPIGNALIAVATGIGEVTVGATSLFFSSPGVLVVKLDPNGTALWGVALENATSAAVATDATGAAYVTGDFASPFTIAKQSLTGAGSIGAYLAKLGPGGELLWARSLQGPSGGDSPFGSFAPAAVALSDGDPVIAGTYSGRVDVGGVKLGTSRGLDGLVARFDATTGDTRWATLVASADDDTLSAIATSDDGGIVVGGHEDGTPHCPTPSLLYAKLSNRGRVAWMKRTPLSLRIAALALDGLTIIATGAAARPFSVSGGSVVDAPGFVFSASGPDDFDWLVPTTFAGEAISVDPLGQITAAGSAPDGTASVLKVDDLRELFYQHVYVAHPNAAGSPASLAIHALGLAPDGGVVVAGGIVGRADLALGFGGAPIASTNGPDAFVARLAP